MNAYEQKLADRKAYYARKAEQLKEQANEATNKSWEMLKDMPLGQPVIIDNARGRNHLRLIERSHAAMNRSVELRKKAEYYEDKAAAKSNAISTYDDDCISKLKERVEELQKEKAEMQLNRANFKRFEFAGISAKIKAAQKRIAQLEAKQERPAVELIREGYAIKEDKKESRLCITFDKKPGLAVINLVKQWNFKWSPTRLCWVRMNNGNGFFAAKQVAIKLKEFKEIGLI